MSDIDDILLKSHFLDVVEELKELIETDFEGIEILSVIWQVDDIIHQRCFGSTTEVIGLLARAQFILERQDTGKTENTED